MKFLGYYKDQLKSELLKFKNGNNIAIERWLKIISKTDVVNHKKIDYIIRALGSRETTPLLAPLDKVGIYLESKLEAKYIPKILSKKITPQLKFLGKYDRKQAIQNSYNCMEKLNIKENSSFLIIDDVITTGATGNEIARALIEAYGNNIKIFHFALVYTPLSQEYQYQEQQYNQKFYKKLIAS